MAGDGGDGASTGIFEELGGANEGTAGVYEIIDEDDIEAVDIADEAHFGDFVGTGAHFVADDHGDGEEFRVGEGTFGAAHIGSGDAQGVGVELFFKVIKETSGGVEVIDGDVEEALDLVGMEVHGDEPVDACTAEEVGNELGADGDAGLVFPVLSSPTEVRDDGDDGFGGGTFGGVDEEEELHEVVGVREGGLDDEDMLAADGFFVGDGELTVCEANDIHFAEGAVEVTADTLGEERRGGT
jgi:hypothetical protein